MLFKVQLFLLSSFFICYNPGNAQTTEQCNNNLSFFHEFVKAENYDAAIQPWTDVRTNCPDLSIAIYSDGEKILKHHIETNQGSEKAKSINDLIALWGQRIHYFPDKTPKGEFAAKACQLAYDYRDVLNNNDLELYNCFDKAFQQDKSTFVNPKSLYTYFSLMVDLYDTGKKTDVDLFTNYDEVTEKIDYELKTYTQELNKFIESEEQGSVLNDKQNKQKKMVENYLENYDLIYKSIDKKLGIRADCKNLIPIYQRDFEANKGDSLWLRRSVSRMFYKECTEDPLYETLVKQYDAVAPSAETKIYVVTVLLKNGKTSEVDRYLNEAYNLETDSYKKANLAYRIGTILKNKGQYSQARDYFNNSLRLNPSNGKAHLAIAAMYNLSAKDCGDSNFNKRGVYWLAAQEARKAAKVDPTLKTSAIQFAESYEAKAPTKQEIFIAEMAGKPLKIGCWINITINVPKL